MKIPKPRFVAFSDREYDEYEDNCSGIVNPELKIMGNTWCSETGSHVCWWLDRRIIEGLSCWVFCEEPEEPKGSFVEKKGFNSLFDTWKSEIWTGYKTGGF